MTDELTILDENETDLLDAFDESGDMMGVDVLPEDYKNVPGWVALEFFLRGELGITHEKAINAFRTFYNHYLKRFPVHYFTQSSIPGMDFALFFPVKMNRQGARNPYYLVAVSDKNRKIVLFHQNLLTQIKTRENFFRIVDRWYREGFSNNKVTSYDISEILTICEKPEEMLALRQARFSGFLKKLEMKMNRMRLDRHFKGKWERIREFFEARDKHYIHAIVNRIKSNHISFEAAKQAGKISKNNLHIYNWMMAGEGPEAVRNRVQIGEYFPWLASAMASDKVSFAYKDIEKVVDAGEPLTQALQEFLALNDLHPLNASTVRKMLRISIDEDLLLPEKLRPLMQVINDSFAHEALERNLLRRLEYFRQQTQNTFSYIDSSWAGVLARMPAATRSDFFELGQENLMSKYLPEERLKHRVSDVANTHDYMRRIYQQLVLPYFVYRAHKAGKTGLSEEIRLSLEDRLWTKPYTQRLADQDTQPPFLRPFGNMELHNIVKLSMKWHDSLKQVFSRFYHVNASKDVAWPALTHTVTADNGISLIPLASQNALIAEHEELGHCIDGYTPFCLGIASPGAERTYSHVFALKSKDKKYRATVTILEPYNGGPKRYVAEGDIDGPRKKKDTWCPPEEGSPLRVAIKWYVDSINSGKIKIDWKQIDKERAEAQQGPTLAAISDREIGYDATDLEKIHKAFFALQPFLPDRYRECSYDTWVKRMGFDIEADRFFSTEKNDLSVKEMVALEFALGRDWPQEQASQSPSPSI